MASAAALFSSADADDPLTRALQPPPDESPDDRDARLQQQRAAQAVSHEIDQTLQEDKKAYDRRKKAIKILLLGAPSLLPPLPACSPARLARPGRVRKEHHAQECVSLSLHALPADLLTRSLSRLPARLLALALPQRTRRLEDHHPAQPHPVRRSRLADAPTLLITCARLPRSIKRLLEVLQEEWDQSVAQPASRPDKGKGVAGRAPPAVRFSTSPLTDAHRKMRMRLSPLLPIEEQLSKRLFPEAHERLHDVCVPAGSGWKSMLASLSNGGVAAPAEKERRPGTADRDDPTAVLAACKDDIVALWEDPVVRAVLKKHNVRLQDMPGL